ncbi:dihydrodipicolinate synthase family protein [Bauldia litoralis]|uniref:dihydrodipicolinate synthase family protein n=3 Tax=Bauldia litoralis TaxID=665467 RepID=UPI003263A7B2
MPGLPTHACLMVAIATPVGRDLRPDQPRLIARIRQLLAMGCDGIALFGTTGEGPALTVADRVETLDAVVAAGIDPARLVVSVGALPVADIARLARHATDAGVEGVLLMPPCAYRDGITEDGTFRFFEAVIDRVERSALRLYLYHFPGISGVPITAGVVRRLDERYPGTIAGIKDSGGDADYTEMLVRRFSHLSIFTGSEVDVPDLMATGLRGTICGLGNVMPRLMRVMMDQPTAFDRRAFLPLILSGDVILSRGPFIPSAKSVVAASLGDPDWRRVLPPLAEIPILERDRLVADFDRWDASLPAECQSLDHDVSPTSGKVVSLRRA